MKNQYFGDINDYKKYGILRTLSSGGKIKIDVCRMLTEDNDNNEGKFIDYLTKPDKFRKYDPELFDSLSYSVKEIKQRKVTLASELNLIENALYYDKFLTDYVSEREKYFSDFKEYSRDCDLLFFDPDNGIEVGSKPYGMKISPNSYTHDFFNGKNVPKTPEEIPIEAWFSESFSYQKDRFVFEQCHQIPDLNSVLAMVWEK